MSEQVEDPRIFFVHIQKTAGGTLRQYIRSNLARGEVYPEGGFDEDPMASYWEVDRLRAITPERLAGIRAFIGHFPYIAAELVPVPVVTVTVLRDPIERTISYLKMRAKDPERRGMGPMEIYEHGFDFPCFIHNHQAKIFAMTTDDRLETFMDRIEVDEERLAIAKANLDKIDILGLQEHSELVMAEVGARFGWGAPEVEDQHVGQADWTIDQSFRDRIAEDNAVDIEFYEYGRRLWEQRHADAGTER